MQKAVCDTSTLIKLIKGEALDCLEKLFFKVYIPQGVKEECLDTALARAIEKSFFEIHQVNHILSIGMGKGEREAISLAKEQQIETIITDDHKALRKASQLGLLPLTTEDILIIAKEKGIIPFVFPIIHKMIKAGEGIKKEVYLETLEAVGELKIDKG
ncbi:putative DUF3368 domain-containing protein [Candidatus Magnetomoraceae bacterium gMMP-15]